MNENTENTTTDPRNCGAVKPFPEQKPPMECDECGVNFIVGDKYFERADDGAPVCEGCRDCGNVSDEDIVGGFFANPKTY